MSAKAKKPAARKPAAKKPAAKKPAKKPVVLTAGSTVTAYTISCCVPDCLLTMTRFSDTPGAILYCVSEIL